MRFRLIALSFVAFLTGTSVAVGEEKVSLIQYNVKGSGSGWVTGSPNIEYKLQLMSDVIKTKSVDFITLEEADEYGGVASPLLSDELEARGVLGWRTISSSCNKDVVQIGYSSSWTLVGQLGSLAGHTAGFGWNGCTGRHGRPYDIGLFKNKATNRSILIVATHLPHCYASITECADQWRSGVVKFHEDATKILSPSQNAVVVIAGDMNEIGAKATNDQLSIVFTFKNLKKSKNDITCCKVDGWVNSFDHVATTGPTAPSVDVKLAPPEVEKYFASEEHRMIYSEVLLSY